MKPWIWEVDGFDPKEGRREASLPWETDSSPPAMRHPYRDRIRFLSRAPFLPGGYKRPQTAITGRVIENKDQVALPTGWSQ